MDASIPSQLVLGHALRRYTKAQLAAALGTDPRTVMRWGDGSDLPMHYKLAILYLLSKFSAPPRTDGDFTFIDLFAGIGGMRLAFEGAGGGCLFTSEWDEQCQKTYRENFGDEEIHGDITRITDQNRFDLIPEHDVLLAGFPCQPFSIAGVSKKNSLGRAHGFACEAQGTLFFHVAKIIKERQPLAFVLENVKNLQSHDGGNTFKVIMKVLTEDLGYWVPPPQIIDAKGFVPQHRERIFIVGFRREVGFSWDALRRPDPTAVTLGSILHKGDGSEEPEGSYTLGAKARVNPKYTLSDKLWNYLVAYKEKHSAKGNGFGCSVFKRSDIARTLSARYFKDGSEILIDQGKRKNPRRLTPRECARLMGFDTAERQFRIPVSDTSAYKQFGNSVVVPVVSEVARIMKPFVMQLKESEAQGVHQGILLPASAELLAA
jgi:DNA (cytosine-5)-methyltransferase 1